MEDCVRKGNSSRILSQGSYIKHLRNNGIKTPLPEIYDFDFDYEFYEMERLQEIDWTVESASRILEEAFTVLEQEFWCKNVEGKDQGFIKEVDPICLLRFLKDLEDKELQEAFEKLPIPLIYNFDEAIHGDPTLANCMLRDSELVLIDPIPPENKIPASSYVDRGKLLQSYFGYEQIIRPGFPDIHPDLYKVIMDGLDDEEEQMVLFFCALHFLRILPYREDQPEVKNQIKSKLKEVKALLKF